MNENAFISTGLSVFDKLLHGLKAGDSVVWRVDSIENYIPFIIPFCESVKESDSELIYFRFAKHKQLIPDDSYARTYEINPKNGFEKFITFIHDIIETKGKNCCYIFDSLSDIPDDCYSDRMLGNFFKLTCPYLRQKASVAYFAIYRHYHSYHTAGPIEETTQILIDTYRYKGQLYLQPIKVEGRHSSTMYTLHVKENDNFIPIRDSMRTTEVLASSRWAGLRSASYRLVGNWDRHFMHGEEVLNAIVQGDLAKDKETAVLHKLLHLITSEDEKIFAIALKYLSLDEVIQIWKRMIGTGMVGGKSIGMLVANSILKNSTIKDILECHDSFFVGSDVYYTYLVENGCWWHRKKQTNPNTFLEGNKEAKNRMMNGSFPEYIVKRFSDMLDYFGQSPIIVRSSSLLEDNFGNTFAGKYESVFCANQGTLKERLDTFIHAVKIVYMSTISEEALTYRKKRGLLEKDEQMSLLVQRVSGSTRGETFYPQVAGVAFSYNPYAWNKKIDPNAGVLRIVYGLGTRAVNRSDDDYTRIVALNAPEIRPESGFDEIKQYAQRKVDVLNLDMNKIHCIDFTELLKKNGETNKLLFGARDISYEKYMVERGLKPDCLWIITFEGMLSHTNFIEKMREILELLRNAYDAQIDIEFTMNFMTNNEFRINIVQCRPFKVQVLDDNDSKSTAPVPPENIVMKINGGIIGQSQATVINNLIYVVPSIYGSYPERKRYAVARLIGRILGKINYNKPEYKTVLIGPGRWGTTTASLGVPVSFSEISMCTAICEIDQMHEGLCPDLSLGTHFFNEMVEANMLYLGYFSNNKENSFNENHLLTMPNSLIEIIPDATDVMDAVRLIKGYEQNSKKQLYLTANTIEQHGILYFNFDGQQ